VVARVKLQGLNIYQSRGKWYVYRRATGEALIKGFERERADLDREMARPDFIAAYNRPRKSLEAASNMPIETLGGFVNWFTNGDIDRNKDSAKTRTVLRAAKAIRNGPSSRPRRGKTTSRHSSGCGQNSISI
jgi:hypothetical protein